MKVLIAVAGLTMSLAFARPTSAQVPDHLKCFKIRDQLRLTPYTADLSGLVPQDGCRIRVPAAFFCVPSTKTNVSPTPPNDLEGPPANGFACYRVKCPRAALPGVVIEDQFGTRGATPKSTSMLCAPLMPTSVPTSTTTSLPVTTSTAAATTSTTTTVLSTTTTTIVLTCPWTGPPVFDPTTFPGCSPACIGAHCVPASIFPPAEQVLFAACTGGLCAPDPIIATDGNYIPPSCVAFAGTTAEGRCLSTCLPGIAAQPSLEQSTCAAGEKCAPCTDPYTDVSTGWCSTSCDAPAQPAFKFPGCCFFSGSSTGTCVPLSQLSAAQQSSLAQDVCPGGSAGYLCEPNEYLPGGVGPSTCSDPILGPGACVSLCVPNLPPLLSQLQCPDNHVCVPCALGPTTPGCS